MTDSAWIAIGFLGQGLFGLSIFYQWLVSERAKASITPAPFWWLRIGGSIILFNYAWLHLGDRVFMLGSVLPLAPYVRNLWLIKRATRATS